MDMPTRLKQARSRANLTQKQLGDKVALSVSAISSYEQGKKVPTLDVAAKIAHVLGVSLDWLVSGDDSQRSITTKGDLVRFLYAVSDKMGGVFAFKTHYRESISMEIDDRDILTYFAACERMEQNFKDGLIDKEILELWREKQLKNLDIISIRDRARINEPDEPF